VTEDHAGLRARETTCLSLRAAVLSSSHSNARSGIAELQHRLSDSQGVWWHWLLPMGVTTLAVEGVGRHLVGPPHLLA